MVTTPAAALLVAVHGLSPWTLSVLIPVVIFMIFVTIDESI